MTYPRGAFVTTDKTAVALRILGAINKRQHPEEKDIALLRAYCPDTRDLAPDEMACLVIQQSIQERHKARENDTDSSEGLSLRAGK